MEKVPVRSFGDFADTGIGNWPPTGFSPYVCQPHRDWLRLANHRRGVQKLPLANLVSSKEYGTNKSPEELRGRKWNTLGMNGSLAFSTGFR